MKGFLPTRFAMGAGDSKMVTPGEVIRPAQPVKPDPYKAFCKGDHSQAPKLDPHTAGVLQEMYREWVSDLGPAISTQPLC